jgi:hypothetical protein
MAIHIVDQEASLLIVQSSHFSNRHIHHYWSCCGSEAIKDIPAIQKLLSGPRRINDFDGFCYYTTFGFCNRLVLYLILLRLQLLDIILMQI